MKSTDKTKKLSVLSYMNITNSALDNVNGMIKGLNSTGRGYEFETLRNKLFFGL